jgi:hypothetical protein
MPLRFELSPPKLAQSLDWYWQFGVRRIKDHPDHVLARGSWLDSLYAIANARRPAAADRKTLAVWGPSQSGKSTLLSAYLDGEMKEGPKGEFSTLLTWNEAEPVSFLWKGKAGVVSLNPFAAGADASGCVTRYTAATSVRDPRYPVRLKFNSLSHVMHALAFGYLSECNPATADGTKIPWYRDRITKEFLKTRTVFRVGEIEYHASWICSVYSYIFRP